MFLSFPDFSGFFPIFSDGTTRLTVAPSHVDVISGFSGFFQLFPMVPPVSQLLPLMLMSIPNLFDFFRFVPPASQLFRFMLLSFPDLFDLFRCVSPTDLFSDSDRPSHKCSVSSSCHFRTFRILPTSSDGTTDSQLFSFMFLSFLGLSDFSRICPAATKMTGPLVV